MGPFARGKTSSLPNVVAANSPRWDENRNHGKDEATESRCELVGKNTIVTNNYCMSIAKHCLTFHPSQAL